MSEASSHSATTQRGPASDARTFSGRVIEITLAAVDDLPELTPLVDQARVSRNAESDPPAVNQFLFERLINHELYIYIARTAETEQVVGFIQLNPGFDVLALQPVWTIGLLFVAPESRRQGLGSQLIQAAQDLVAQREDKGLLIDIEPGDTAFRQFLAACHFQPQTASSSYLWKTV